MPPSPNITYHLSTVTIFPDSTLFTNTVKLITGCEQKL